MVVCTCLDTQWIWVNITPPLIFILKVILSARRQHFLKSWSKVFHACVRRGPLPLHLLLMESRWKRSINQKTPPSISSVRSLSAKTHASVIVLELCWPTQSGQITPRTVGCNAIENYRRYYPGVTRLILYEHRNACQRKSAT